MGLGLKNLSINQKVNNSSSTTLLNVLENRKGFALNYLPELRELNGQKYIRTIGRGNDVDNKPVFFKWIFIDPTDLSATSDSDSEYALIPKEGFIMRIMQRSLLPYHENFIIDYYEDINAMKIITMDDELKEEYSNKTSGAYRSFRVGDIAVPNELKSEIYNYPKEFFTQYIEAAIPLDLLYVKESNKSNHISSYGSMNSTSIDMSIMSHGLNMNQPVKRSASVNNRSLQSQLSRSNSQFSGTGIRTAEQVMGSRSNYNAKTIQDIINRQIPK